MKRKGMSKAKINDPAFADRMQTILKEKFNDNNSEFARAIGVAITSLNRWLEGEADPSRSNLVKTANAAGVSLQWLATGEKTEKPERNIVFEALQRAREKLEGGISMIFAYPSINVSAGFGSFNEGVTEPEGEEPYSDALLASLGVKAERCAVFWANGDSMEPTIADGDQMLVDLTKTEVKGDNKVYLVQNGESIWVKRLRQGWGYVELISDNEDYEPIKLSGAESQYLQVIGQVVHIGHSL